MEYYSAIKMRKSYPLQQHGWTLRRQYAKWNKTEKGEYYMIPPICGSKEKKQTHKKWDQICGYQSKKVGEWELEKSGQKALTPFQDIST